MEAPIYKRLYDLGLSPIYVEYAVKEVKVNEWSTLSREEAIKTFDNKDKFNMAILTGERSNIIVFDADVREKNGKMDKTTDRFYKSILKKYPEFNDTVKCRTGSGNFHHYFQYDERLKSCDYRYKFNNYHFEILSNKRCAVCPKSEYMYGKKVKRYKWINNPFDNEILKMPEGAIEILISLNKKIVKTDKRILNNNMDFSLSQYPIKTTKERGDYIYYNFDDSKEAKTCPFVGRVHGQNHNYIEYSKLTKIYKRKCWSGHCKGKSEILHFDKTMNDKLNYILNCGITDRNVAELAYELCKDIFIRCKKSWFCLNKYGKIDIDDSQYKLWEYISNVFKSYINDMNWDLKDRKRVIVEKLNGDFESVDDQLKADEENIELEEQIKILNGVCKNLESVTHKNKIMKELEYMLTNNKKGDKLNRGAYLIGFDNGVYDLKTKEFRLGTLEDMVSMSVGYDYNAVRDEKIQKKINKFLEDIFIDQDIRQYVLSFLGSCLEGYNKENVASIWDGYGSNAKSTIKNFINCTLGAYSGDMARSYISNTIVENPKSADAELIDALNKRIMFFTEPSSINKETLKNLTGMDGISARQLYSNDIVRSIPLFCIFILLNNSMNMNLVDPTNGIKRRLRNTPFETKFIETDELTEEDYKNNKRKIDKNLSDNFDDWKMEFFHILLDEYYKYKEHGLITPKIIKDSSDRFLNEENPYKDWVDECITKTDDDDDIITLVECIRSYNYWIGENSAGYMNKKPTSKKLMRINIENLLDCKVIKDTKINNQRKKDLLRCYKLKKEEEEEESTCYLE